MFLSIIIEYYFHIITTSHVYTYILNLNKCTNNAFLDMSNLQFMQQSLDTIVYNLSHIFGAVK